MAHRPGAARRKKTEAELLELDNHSHDNAERGMRHKPPRLDSKYQILPGPRLSEAEQQAEAAAKAAEIEKAMQAHGGEVPVGALNKLSESEVRDIAAAAAAQAKKERMAVEAERAAVAAMEAT